MDQLEPFRRRVREAETVPPPPPWRQVTVAPVGGLTEVGFADKSDLLLVLSAQGRGIFDCSTGQRLARDAGDDRSGWYGSDALLAHGFGPLEGQHIRLCGLWGGGLPTWTKDQWHIERITLHWPDENLLLFGPDSPGSYTADGKFYKLDAPITEVRAFGFSYTGQTLVIATGSDVTLFGRP